MRIKTWTILVCLLLAAPFLEPPARAGQYAAMDEIPVEGGELRLVAPVRMRTTGDDGVERTVEMIGFPLRHTRVDIDVAGSMTKTTLEQTFANPFDHPVEAVYVFPLGDDAAVCGYRIAIGDRLIHGTIQTRAEARRRYQQARQEGKTAGLVEQTKANVFTQKLANLAPGEPVRVQLDLVELIEPAGGLYQIVFPTVVGPRYLPAGRRGRRPVGARPAGTPGDPAITSVAYHRPGAQSNPALEVLVHLDAGVPVGEPESPSHHITTRRTGDTSFEVRLADEAAHCDRDFILRYRPDTKTHVGLLAHRDGGQGTFVLLVQPKQKYRTGDIAPREVIVLIDRSGSMQGVPLAQAKAVARGILDTLTERDVFNLLAFSDGVDAMGPQPVTGDEQGRARGHVWLDSLTAGGGTELERGVLRSLARQPGADRIRMVYMLSDGFVGNDDVILGAVQRAGGRSRGDDRPLAWRLFPVGIGSAPNRYLIDRLAEVGRGYPSYLTGREEPDEVLQTLLRRSAYPYLTDISIDWGDLEVSAVTPAVLPDVYAGLPLVVAGRYRKPGEAVLKLSATAAGRRIAIDLPVRLPARADRPAVAHLWARKRIHALMARSYGHVDKKTEQVITDLGLAHGLVTDFTSYVAVDETRVVDASGRARTVVQTAPMPEGVNFDTAVGGGNRGRMASAPPPPSSTPHRSSGGGFRFGGGGGDLDPVTLAVVLGLVPLAWVLRRRRSA